MIDRTWRPQFIVIGAVKAATTWIQARLVENPAIFMPPPEPHYFSSEFERGEEWYRAFFQDRPGAAHLIGEKSADYLAHPLAARRIAATLPDVKLVLQLRNPVERAYSDYKMLYRRGTVKGPPEDYLTTPDNPFARFLEDGLYARHLARWFDLFPREQMLIYLYDDVITHPHAIIEAVSRHIGAEPVFEADRTARENNSRSALLPLPLRKALAPLKSSVRPLRGNPVFESMRSLLAREVAYPPLPPALRERMRDFYSRDIESLEAMSGLDLARWKSPTRAVPAA
ncbi:sulfotransferase [Novosphingobium sp. BL-8H]|uniref:sulfotransferase family protein n=1 Tax=Novosphingobium sp. BL-8H TaxID=3127640 RepID=UPI003757DB59